LHSFVAPSVIAVTVGGHRSAAMAVLAPSAMPYRTARAGRVASAIADAVVARYDNRQLLLAIVAQT
jgi:hypothetical protein